MNEKDVTRDEVVEEILSAYEGVSREQAEGDVDAFEAKLRGAGILE